MKQAAGKTDILMNRSNADRSFQGSNTFQFQDNRQATATQRSIQQAADAKAGNVLQGQFYFGGALKNRDMHVKALWNNIKDKHEVAIGDKKILEGLVRDDNDVFPGRDMTLDTLMDEIKNRRVSKKRKRSDEKPEDYQPRSTKGIGKKVDWETDRKFRVERRLRRRSPFGGRNLYTTDYDIPEDHELPDGFEEPPRKRVKLVTASQPPGSLPKGHESMSEEELVAVTKIGHSEEQTDDIEKNFPFFQGLTRTGEATTREQCKDCRHNYPSTNLEHHHYGYPYSAPEDHIHDTSLRKRIIDNKGKVSGLSLNPTEQKDFTSAKDSATWDRQYHEDQNPALIKAYKKIEAQTEDSDGEYSDDEEPVFLPPFLYNRIAPKLKKGKLGKAPVYKVPAKHNYSKEQFKTQKSWIEEQKKKPQKTKDNSDGDTDMSEESDEG